MGIGLEKRLTAGTAFVVGICEEATEAIRAEAEGG